jgi:hypothetical protein
MRAYPFFGDRKFEVKMYVHNRRISKLLDSAILSYHNFTSASKPSYCSPPFSNSNTMPAPPRALDFTGDVAIVTGAGSCMIGNSNLPTFDHEIILTDIKAKSAMTAPPPSSSPALPEILYS